MHSAGAGGAIDERDLQATTREDAKIEFMGICRVLSLKTAYVLEVATELIVISHTDQKTN
jgi:hypothetical protein